MQEGICALSVAPLRAEPSDRSEMTNQVLFGEHYAVLETRSKWLRIRLTHDGYEGWLDRRQNQFLPGKASSAQAEKKVPCVAELIEIVNHSESRAFFPVFLGSPLPDYNIERQNLKLGDAFYGYQGAVTGLEPKPDQLIEVAHQYLHAPYLWGGRSPFGIDCSGLVQMVYRLCGYSLPRDAQQQAQVGETLSFIEEAQEGDLAFFDNEEGDIVHVGLIMANNYIIHASGKVRIDRLDQSGIFNGEERRHTHKLRVIKKVLT